MDVTKVAHAILLLLPGFLFVKSFNASARPRRVSDLELMLWSIALSVLLLLGVRSVLDLWRPQPSFTAIAGDPTKASAALRWTLFGIALLGG